MSTTTIIPAIDLRDGRVVRLAQGDYARETRYAPTPLDLARSYRDAGAEWLHVVDLDGAREGGLGNLETIAALCGSGLKVQCGGGVRAAADVERLLGAGVARVVVGSVAVSAPETVLAWLAQYGVERICLALDTRWDGGAWTLPVRGWTAASAQTLDGLAPRFAAAGAKHLLCTDIARDGMLQGPNLSLYEHLAHIAPALAVQASGGVRDVHDVSDLRELGVAGVILGRSLLEGRLTVQQALAC